MAKQQSLNPPPKKHNFEVTYLASLLPWTRWRASRTPSLSILIASTPSPLSTPLPVSLTPVPALIASVPVPRRWSLPTPERYSKKDGDISNLWNVMGKTGSLKRDSLVTSARGAQRLADPAETLQGPALRGKRNQPPSLQRMIATCDISTRKTPQVIFLTGWLLGIFHFLPLWRALWALKFLRLRSSKHTTRRWLQGSSSCELRHESHRMSRYSFPKSACFIFQKGVLTFHETGPSRVIAPFPALSSYPCFGRSYHSFCPYETFPYLYLCL